MDLLRLRPKEGVQVHRRFYLVRLLEVIPRDRSGARREYRTFVLVDTMIGWQCRVSLS